MTTLNVTDENTGSIVSVDVDSPTGNLYIRDAEGNLVQLDLSNPVGTIKVIDADTGNTVTLDYSDPTAVFTVIDPNTGEFVDVDLSNLSGILYCLDENTGEFVQIDLSSARFAHVKGLTIPIQAGDTVFPTVVITLSQYTFAIGETATITFTFSEEVLNFTAADVTSPNGSLSSFTITGNPLIYTATFTPTNGVTDATNVITVGTSWTDLNGNPPAGSTNSSNYTVDTTAPTVSTFTVTSPSTSRDIPVTAFTASEAGVSFIITENSTPPAAGAAGWVGTAPTTYTVSADGTYTLYPWVKDAAGNVSAEFGSPRTVVVLALPFTDNFTRANGAIGGQWTGATWTIASNAALNTPTAGAETLTNGDFSAWTGDDPDNWVVSSESGSDPAVSEVGTGEDHTGAGTGAANFYATATRAWLNQSAGTGKTWALLSAVVSFASGVGFFMRDSSGANPTPTYTTTGTKTAVIRTRATTPADLQILPLPGAHDVTLDSVSMKMLTTSTLYATLPSVGIANVTAQVVIAANPAGTQGGVILNLDSISSPANFVIAYLDGQGNARLDKCVAGTYTNVIDGAVTWGATNNLKVIKNGDDYSLYYGAPGSEAQVGTTQSVTGMTGTIHGLFSTNSSVTLDTYQLAATP